MKAINLQVPVENYPWLTSSSSEYSSENGWRMIKFRDYLDRKINEKVSESDYRSGVRYLRVKILKNPTEQQNEDFNDKMAENTKVQYRWCKIQESDLLELDLSQDELTNGHRFLKIYLPHYLYSKGWVSLSEKNDGWKVSGEAIPKRVYLKKKKEKKDKFMYKNKRVNSLNSVSDEVKKYIKIE